MISRGLSATAAKPIKPIEGDTREFADRVAHIFRERSRKARRGRHDDAPAGETTEAQPLKRR